MSILIHKGGPLLQMQQLPISCESLVSGMATFHETIVEKLVASKPCCGIAEAFLGSALGLGRQCRRELVSEIVYLERVGYWIAKNA